MFGIEQEYTFFQDGRPYGWPEDGLPRRPRVRTTAASAERRCPDATSSKPTRSRACAPGIGIEGTNAEVMMGQWEFQVGVLDPLEVGDQLWVARWLLERIAEEFDVDVSFDAKPIKGDWNGAGAHTNFSTKQMRAHRRLGRHHRRLRGARHPGEGAHRGLRRRHRGPPHRRARDRPLLEVLLRRLRPRLVGAHPRRRRARQEGLPRGPSSERQHGPLRRRAPDRRDDLRRRQGDEGPAKKAPAKKVAAKKTPQEGGEEGSGEEGRRASLRRSDKTRRSHGRRVLCFMAERCAAEEGARMSPMQSQAQYVLRTVEERGIRFVQLWFTDVLGRHKAFHVTPAELEDALDQGMTFDGSSIDGFSRTQESDVLARPDLTTFQLLPWYEEGAGVARVFCDIVNIDGTPFDGCPRQQLRRVLDGARAQGYTFFVAPEIEYFYFEDLDPLAPSPADRPGSYFDLLPDDTASQFRRRTVLMLEEMGIGVEHAQHEDAPVSTRSTCATPTR